MAAQAVDIVRVVVVATWAGAGTLVCIRRRADLVGVTALAGAALGALAMAAAGTHHPRALAVFLGLLVGCGFQLLLVLPNGHLGTPTRRVAAIAGFVVAGLTGLLVPAHRSGPTAWPFVLLWALALAIGLPASNMRYRAAAGVDRQRMQWIGWAFAVGAELSLIVVALRLMADWPPHPTLFVLAATVLIPAALVAGTSTRTTGRVDQLLTHTVSIAGLTALVIVAYGAVVVVLGRSPRDGERSLLLLSMAAALVAALVSVPLRAKLADAANQAVYGELVAPEQALRTWGSRLTRSIPLDELLLQLTESLRTSMRLAAAEIFTGGDGRYELVAGVPHRDAPALILGAKEQSIVATAGVSGGTWLDVWMPRLAASKSAMTRVAPIAHGGALLGLIVLTRRDDGDQLSDDDDRVLTELARQVALALHNVQLDSALQASLAELQQSNTELQDSRLRIVTAGDAERRRLERNLHDGAQQHLVAMAVKLRMVEELIDDDPHEASKVVEELRESLKDAIVELRALAHGIFPPLLSSGGLREALPAAAARAALPTNVDASGTKRYSPEVESTVYFCCLEALQNAGKHAGDDAEIEVRVCDDGDLLTFEVTDDGAGFDPSPSVATGHGFVNMTDRLGAVGGRLHVTSASGAGTTVRGEIPLSSDPATQRRSELEVDRR